MDDNGNLVNNHKAISDLLQDQFKSVFNKHNDNLQPHLSIKPPNITYPLSDLSVSVNDVQKAINKMKTYSSCPAHEIPAKIFKECKETLSLPLQLFFNKFFNSGTVPSSYKVQQVTPVYKNKGLKTDDAC